MRWALALMALAWLLRQDDAAPRLVDYPIPPQGLTEGDVHAWAQQMGVTPDELVLAIVVGSEALPGDRTPMPEQLGIAHAVLNRLRLRYWGDTVWRVAMGPWDHTGDLSDYRRPFASTRPPKGARLAHMLDVARQAINAQRIGHTAAGVTHFIHAESASWRDKIVRARDRQGYVPVKLPGTSSLVTFFAPKPGKPEWLQRNRAGWV